MPWEAVTCDMYKNGLMRGVQQEGNYVLQRGTHEVCMMER